jgi:hypothetical protein
MACKMLQQCNSKVHKDKTGCGLDLSCSEWVLGVECSEKGNETEGCLKGRPHRRQLND